VSDTIDFRFWFSAESPASLSVAHTVSAECVTSLSVYFRFRPLVFARSVHVFSNLKVETSKIKHIYSTVSQILPKLGTASVDSLSLDCFPVSYDCLFDFVR